MILRVTILFCITLNLCRAQGWEWVNQVNIGGPSTWFAPVVKTDPQGNFYMLSRGTNYFRKILPNGSIGFTITISKGIIDFAFGANRIYLAGNVIDTMRYNGWPVITTNGSSDMVIITLDLDGNLIDIDQFGTSSRETLEAICTDQSGNILITGEYSQPLTFGAVSLPGDSVDGLYLAKLDPDRNFLQAKRVAGIHFWGTSGTIYSGYSGVSPRAMHCSSSGKVSMMGFLGGKVRYTNGDSLKWNYYGGYFFAFFNSDLEPTRVIQRSRSKSHEIHGSCLLNDRLVTNISAGSQYGTLYTLYSDNDDNSSEIYDYQEYAPVTVHGGASLDESNNLYIHGNYGTINGTGTAEIDGIDLMSYYSGGGSYILKKPVSGPSEVLHIFEEIQFHSGLLTSAPNGDLYLLGKQWGAVNFGTLNFPANSPEQWFVAKWSTTPLSNQKLEADKFKVFPNPSSGIININSDLAISSVCIIDELGRRYPCSISLQSKKHSFDISHLANGIYSLQARTDQGVSTSRFIIAR